MKSNIVSTNFKTGKYITKVRPHTLTSFNDNTERKIPDTATGQYNTLHVITAPKGLTNQIITFDGDGAEDKFHAMFGHPNTIIYGKAFTYAERCIKSGFTANVLNTSPPDATHANILSYFRINQGTLEDTLASGVPSNVVDRKTRALYYSKNTPVAGGEEFYFSFDKNDPELGATSTMLAVPNMRIGFEVRSLSGVSNTFDPATFLEEDEYKIDMPADGDSMTTAAIQAPVFGMFHGGAVSDGNNHSLNVTEVDIQIKDKYPLYQMIIKDQDVESFKFQFALFNVRYENLSAYFSDVVNKYCKMVFTTKNEVELFRPYTIKRKQANALKSVIKTSVTRIMDELVATIVAAAIPGFDIDASVHNLEDMRMESMAYADEYMAADDIDGRSIETVFSRITPWTALDYPNVPFIHTSIPTELKLLNGSSGELATILENEDFSWDITNAAGEKIILDLAMKAFRGEIDETIFDPRLVRDSQIFGDGFPIELQEVVEELVRYREDLNYYDKSRPDFTYWRSPQDRIRTMQDVLGWSDSILAHNPSGKNMNTKLFVGKAMFEDSTTGGQTKFDLIYDYLGSDSALFGYLNSGSPNPFASGSWSKIKGAVTNTFELLPNDEESELLSRRDINYYGMNSDRSIGLKEDTALNMGNYSSLKSIASTPIFNKIWNTCYCVGMDNMITSLDNFELSRIVKVMLSKIPPSALSHFENAIEITPTISTHPQEIGKDVVEYTVTVKKDTFSRYNKVTMNVEKNS